MYLHACMYERINVCDKTELPKSHSLNGKAETSIEDHKIQTSASQSASQTTNQPIN